MMSARRAFREASGTRAACRFRRFAEAANHGLAGLVAGAVMAKAGLFKVLMVALRVAK